MLGGLFHVEFGRDNLLFFPASEQPGPDVRTEVRALGKAACLPRLVLSAAVRIVKHDLAGSAVDKALPEAVFAGEEVKLRPLKTALAMIIGAGETPSTWSSSRSITLAGVSNPSAWAERRW